MALSTKILSVLVPLILLLLLIPAGIALHRIQSLNLPIPTVTAAATLILPVATGGILWGAQSLTRRSLGSHTDSKPIFSWTAVLMITFLVVYDTIIATLSLTYMVPPHELNCGLERRWASLFSHKDAGSIRRIQDRHQCCGFNSPADRAWPFPSRRHTALACTQTFGRERSCRDGWRQDEQVTAGLMLLVAIAAFLLKLLTVFVSQARRSLNSSQRDFFASLAGIQEDGGAEEYRRRIQGPAAFRDHVPDEEDGGASEQAASENTLRLPQQDHVGSSQPLRDHNAGEEWRET